MKILVAISKTPETTAKISFKDNNTSFDSSGVNYIMNPYDEWYALVRALELKESTSGTVSVIHVGPAENDVIIRKALAIGADDAYRVDSEAKSAYFTAKQIAAHAKDQGYDLLLFGKETIDYASALVPGMVAELLGLPFFSFASHLEVNGNTAEITRDIEGGEEVSTAEFPIVISAAKGLAQQRIPNMRGIMMAKRKPLNVVTPIEFEEKVAIKHFELPLAKTEVKMIDPENMDELVRLLHEEAKVI